MQDTLNPQFLLHVSEQDGGLGGVGDGDGAGDGVGDGVEQKVDLSEQQSSYFVQAASHQQFRALPPQFPEQLDLELGGCGDGVGDGAGVGVGEKHPYILLIRSISVAVRTLLVLRRSHEDDFVVMLYLPCCHLGAKTHDR